jgi:hypothetical protein
VICPDWADGSQRVVGLASSARGRPLALPNGSHKIQQFGDVSGNVGGDPLAPLTDGPPTRGECDKTAAQQQRGRRLGN